MPNTLGQDLEKYGFLEVESMILSFVYDWIRDIKEVGDESADFMEEQESEEFSESDNFSEWDISNYGSSRETGTYVCCRFF